MPLIRRRPNARLAVACATLLVVATAACAPRNYRGSQLGVLPPQPPKPLWLGAFRAAPADSSLRGAVAVTLSSTPGWSHVLLSLSGARPAASYTWRLHSGRCSDNGPVIGPDERYDPLLPFADGTAKAESTVPGILTPSAPYSVTVTSQSEASPSTVACAELDYGSM
ncbi:MAG: hypothetical protein ACR2GG_02450 [Gemmatimonadaceae bacterium]